MKRKHSVGFPPQYAEKIKTVVDPEIYLKLAKKAFVKLHWDYQEENECELRAFRRNVFGRVTEFIVVKIIHTDRVRVQSRSKNGFWDRGINFERVRELKEAISYQNKLLLLEEQSKPDRVGQQVN